VGVCQYPDSLPVLRGAKCVCSKHSPSSIEPHLGQVSENSSKPSINEHWRVLHEHEPRCHFANDPGHFQPKAAALSVESVAPAGDRNVLAGEASGHNINSSAPRLAVKGPHIVPDGEGWKQSIALSGEQHASTVGIKLNSASGAPSKQVPSQDAASCPCK
jgi:hypothetical protein